MNDYYLTGKRIVEYLKKNQTPDGTIYDEIDEAKTPDNHYAHTYFALAAIQIYENTSDQSWLRAGEKAVEYFLDLPENRRGHREFNNLAILLMYPRLKKLVDSMPLAKMEGYIENMKFDTDSIAMSNNWTAIKAVCHALKFKIFGLNEEKKKAEHLMNDHILRYQLDDGFFYDWPNEVVTESYITPLTYQAKICSMLLMYNTIIKNSNVLDSAIRGLDTLKHFIADDGETFYYGRSNNALFGHISGIYAYEKAAQTVSGNKSAEFRYCATRLFKFIKTWQQEDGHINITPNEYEKERCGWDGYMHSTVYNAYAAGLLLMLSEVKQKQAHQVNAIEKTYYAENAGLLAIREGNFFMSLSTKGQSVPSRVMFSDPRYYGMNPLSMKYKGYDIILPLPLIKTSLKDTSNPSLTGFLPYTKKNDEIYSTRIYDEVKIDINQDSISIFAKGQPTAYIQKILYPSEIRRRIPKIFYLLPQIRRSLRYLYFQYINKEGGGYNVKELEKTKTYRCIIALPKEPIVIFVDSIDTKINESITLNTLSGRFNSPSVDIHENRVIYKTGSINTILEDLLDKKLDNMSTVSVPTSKGFGYVVNNEKTIYPKEKFISAYALYFNDNKIPLFKTKVDNNRFNIDINTTINEYSLELDLSKMSCKTIKGS